MVAVKLDVHKEWPQMSAAQETGEVMIEMKVRTLPEELRRQFP